MARVSLKSVGRSADRGHVPNRVYRRALRQVNEVREGVDTTSAKTHQFPS
jgi:hypothetical protein